MAVKAGDLESELIEGLSDCVAQRLSGESPDSYAEFVRQYYHWVPAPDLTDRNPLDLCGAVVAHWRLAKHRPPGETKVAVYNPDVERHGWHSPYTVVEIVSDDMPFIVDSVTMELSRQGYRIELIVHPVVRVVRDAGDELIAVLGPGHTAPGFQSESVIHAEVARQADADRLAVLRAGVELVLEEVKATVDDWLPMRARATALATELRRQSPSIDDHELGEAEAFLEWLTEDNFTFLGYREYQLGADDTLTAIPGSGLGILRGASATPSKRLDPKALELARSPHPLVLTKANSRATVHRPAYMDYVGVKRFDPDGTVTGEGRFLGLYTTAAYKSRPGAIPLLRDKVERVMSRAGFAARSHDEKALIDILETMPRDLLVQISTDDLFEMAIGILGLGERQRVRLFVAPDQLNRFVACTLCMGRDRFNTANRRRAERIISEEFGGGQVDWSLQLSESVVVRITYVVRCPNGVAQNYDVGAIEARIAEATRAWTDDLRAALVDAHGDQHGLELFARFGDAFPAAYRADWSAQGALVDIDRIGELERAGRPILALYRTLRDGEEVSRCKLLSADRVLLSDVLPTFEHMGAKVLDERPYQVAPAGSDPVWVYDFGLRSPAEQLQRSSEAFADAFLDIWAGEIEDDGLNGLVLAAGLTGREVTFIRAAAKYLRQARIAFSDQYMERALIGNPEVAVLLIRLFQARFDPDSHDPERAEAVSAEVQRAIDEVESLDQDRILRSFLAVVRATLRTNYFRADPSGKPLGYVSFKLDPSRLPMLPQPRPRFEIFVYSPRVEGIHLRGGKVARGGLRWSDRREDFRTEVLGLMKAQMVKNALIVPVGSKGGFVVKRPRTEGGREAQVREAIACYRTFLRGMLDLTDNYDGDRIVPPERVLRYDDDDPYLVVAADRGTASFSDIANDVSDEYGFWLGDAFASGGSHGYDHKQMGITARGAWESVKRHFRELGTDIQREEFSVVGIGDMAGDVFGNGMLLSEHTRLLAAFDHRHVFLDPNPDPAASYAERRRLFELPRSSWSDYDSSVISEGGGVYPRTAKSIPISPQVREALAVQGDRLTPADLIRALLRAPVDLLYNGGIGTFVKASDEIQADASDRANDALRVDAAELRCRVVGEGGNLGFTQRGRIEYALRGGPDGHGGAINTDAIDNAAGVNTSDHEVNIKILLDRMVADGELDTDERNELLGGMAGGVADSVLYASYTQTQAISLELAQAPAMIGVHARLINQLEHDGVLRRRLEYLPNDKVIEERRSQRLGLASPELATLLAYCKIQLYEQLLDSDLPEDPYLFSDLERYFPAPLGTGPASRVGAAGGTGSSASDRYRVQMRKHRLRREVIATVVASQLVDRAGTTFAFRLGEETGAGTPHLARAFAVAREVFEMRSFWAEVEGLDNQVEAQVQLEMLIEGRRLVERATRWLVRAHPDRIEIEGATQRFLPGARMLADALPGVLQGHDAEAYERRLSALRNAGVPAPLARRVATMQAALSVFDIVEDTVLTERSQPQVMTVYFALGSQLGLDWLRDRILELPQGDRWQALARTALRDDLYRLHRTLTRDALLSAEPGADSEQMLADWRMRNEAAVQHALSVLADVRESGVYDTTTLPVALRELKGLVGD